jgi:hypothetical protein
MPWKNFFRKYVLITKRDKWFPLCPNSDDKQLAIRSELKSLSVNQNKYWFFYKN